MKVYVVLFYTGYEGYSSDEKCKVFKDRSKVEKYIKKLNIEYAKTCNCAVEDLGDYYDYEVMDMV